MPSGGGPTRLRPLGHVPGLVLQPFLRPPLPGPYPSLVINRIYLPVTTPPSLLDSLGPLGAPAVGARLYGPTFTSGYLSSSLLLSQTRPPLTTTHLLPRTTDCRALGGTFIAQAARCVRWPRDVGGVCVGPPCQDPPSSLPSTWHRATHRRRPELRPIS